MSLSCQEQMGLDDFLSDADVEFELVAKYKGEVIAKKTSRYIEDVLEKSETIEHKLWNEVEEDFRSVTSESYGV